MTSFRIRPATHDDARSIAPLLREQDVAEIKVASGSSPEAALLAAFDAPGGEIIIAETVPDGLPILIGGVHPTHPRAASIWMVATPQLERYALPSVRESRRWLDHWHQTYPLLWNRASEANGLHVCWLQLLGFNFLRRLDIGGNPFLEFARHQASSCA